MLESIESRMPLHIGLAREDVDLERFGLSVFKTDKKKERDETRANS
jgi:hypothetical protein